MDTYGKAMVLLGRKAARDNVKAVEELIPEMTAQQKEAFEAGRKDAKRITVEQTPEDEEL